MTCPSPRDERGSSPQMTQPQQLVRLLFAGLFSSLLCGCNGSPDEKLDEGMGGAGGAGVTPSRPEYAPGECRVFETVFATEVVGYEFGPGQSFGQDGFPASVLGGPYGQGETAGSLDVVSLGDGGFVELAFYDRVIIDGAGPDFIVFENAFHAGDADGPLFFEPARVSVSEDGVTWYKFPCEDGETPTDTCAGLEPVVFNVEEDSAASLDPATSGGDLFDLAELGLTEARYVRITDLEGDGAVFDLDAVAIVNGRCED